MRYLDRLDIETAAKVKQAAVTLPKAPGPDGVTAGGSDVHETSMIAINTSLNTFTEY
ncbi:hypothetical protein F442_18431 [Phytophthora nicotianae P10297]|uniref:Uncharacterized protein n=1 Tax=Phytophthora nicotianae P10297 TaxID=1317064 RepID=W2YDV9_PHYNI|nr:hypothetical protein F442_18431 [Phytophthora nicotianae P10297]